MKSNALALDGNPEVGAVGDVVTVRGRLALLGWPSLSSWARARGYERVTARQTIARQSDGGGLFLRVKPDRKAAWVWRFTAPSGRRRELGLGVARRAATTSG